MTTIRIFLLMLLPVLLLAQNRGLKIESKATIQRQKIALVVGNSDYKSSPLRNPVNDARAMAATLRRLGFSVVERTNVNQGQMENAIRDFGDQLRRGGVGLFYYAGHGVQVNGSNYLIPVSADIQKESEVKYKAVDAGLVLAQMEDAKNGVNIVILDACRNNPFARSWRSATNGLATVDAPKGTIVSYATAPGKVANDGDRGNGLYTERLLHYMTQPGLTIEEVFKRVRRDVEGKTNDLQTPWEQSSLTGDFYFVSGNNQDRIDNTITQDTKRETNAPKSETPENKNGDEPKQGWTTLNTNPILKQEFGTWDQYNLYISSPIVLKVTSEYQMWYTAGTNYVHGDTQSVAYATSPDGLHWTKHGTVLPRGQAGAWNDRASATGTVLYDDGVYKMWFEGCSMSHSHNGIGNAVSGDGIHWIALPSPIMSVSLDKPQVFAPAIVKTNGVYYLYYTVELKNGGYAESIYLATSTDGKDWRDHGKILDKRNSVPWDGIGPFQPRVIVDEGKFKMYYTTSVRGLTSIASANSSDGYNWEFNSWEPDLTSNDTSPWSTQMVGYPCVMRDGGKLKMWFAGFSSYSSQWQLGYAER